MTLCTQMHDTSNLHEIIPISFNMYNALYETNYRIEPADKYLVQLGSQMIAAGVNLLEVHSTKKTIVINMPIEKQKPQIQQKQVEK